MGMTIAEKILSAKSGKASVTPGEIVEAFPDLVMSHTATSAFSAISGTRMTATVGRAIQKKGAMIQASTPRM